MAKTAVRDENDALEIPHLFVDDAAKVIRIDSLVLDDPDTYAVIADRLPAERLSFVRRAIKVGVIALRDAVIADKVDYVEKHFERLETHLHEVFQKHLGPGGMKGELEKIFGENGELQTSLANIFGEDGKLSKDLLDPDNQNTPIGRLRKSIEASFVGKDSQLYNLLDPHKQDSPANRLREEILKALTDIKTDLQRYFVGKEVEATTSKRGGPFEDEVWIFLNRITRPFGDSVERVGNVPGLRSKKGDILISLSDPNSEGTFAGIVVEAKAHSEPLTLTHKGILGELDEAMKNRNAEFGIAVAEETLPKEAGAFRDYENNKIVCTFAEDGLPLEVAYKIARAKILMRRRADSGAKIDTVKIVGLVEKISTHMRTFQGIKTKLTKVGDLSNEVKSEIDTLRESIQQALDEISRALGPPSL